MKKKTRRMQLSKETLVHLQGGPRGGKEGEAEASYSRCMDTCIGIESDINFHCKTYTTA